MDKKVLINLLQEALEFHKNVRKAYLSPNSSIVLKELYGRDALLLVTVFDFKGKWIELYQFADWSCGNHEYRMDIFINRIHQEKDMKFIKGILKKLQE